MAIGFGREDEPSPREKTKYDSYLGKLVSIEIAGGMRESGIIRDCKRSGAGHDFYLQPAVAYNPNGRPYVLGNEDILVSSSGNAISICPREGSIEDAVAEIDAAVLERKQAQNHSK